MSTTYDKDRHSRSSSETHIPEPDLEKGEARPEQEEEDIAESKVCFVHYIVLTQD